MKTRLALFVATFGYSGFFPVAPGTAGSAAALLLYALVRWSRSPLVEPAVLVAVAVVGTWSASVAEKHFCRTDPGQVVIDEVLGMLLTLAFLPLRWQGVVFGFLVFRALDIAKPFPANVAERLHGGFGIMADDAISGIYGNLVIRMTVWLLGGWV
jgi:phosphatidylglycerophosphatase A